MADLTQKKSNYVSRLSNAVNANTDRINELVALYTEWLALGYAADGAAPIVDEDLARSYPHLSAADLAAVVASLAATKGYLDAAGHTAVFLKMRP